MVALVRDFLNTYAVDTEAEELSSPADLTLWLRERGLVEVSARATEDDLGVAVSLREGLRAALRGEPRELPVLPLRIAVAGRPRLEPVEGGVAGGLARIVAATMDPAWERLKVCAEPTCQWAFVDASKNKSRSWCDMKVCGNRTKTRAYRARKAGSRPREASRTDTV
ncbi:CGNR zinc finger domain-containing protein [Thermoactinospora rubra]|uniref:CGNR zinc finger domain-containing protein n=1 Tax=Thermoactinospora rubra TaxID=1088767 RepID=UPI000A1121D7|nr:CGNR zinc finger domain-containing protein [Thermoactinospora rubra]